MKDIIDNVDALRADVEPFRFVEQYDYYACATDADRLYIKSAIAFVYEHYSIQNTGIQEYTRTYSMCTVEYRKKNASALVVVFPHTVSIPPLIALLLPAQMLSIPIYIFFSEEPQAHTLVALELLGVEDIYIGVEDSIVEKYAQCADILYISSGKACFSRNIQQYSPPIVAEELSLFPASKWLYPDAIYVKDIFCNTKAQDSHVGKENTFHIWIYPSISLECYQIIDYVVRF